jgi:hypothetical protein
VDKQPLKKYQSISIIAVESFGSIDAPMGCGEITADNRLFVNTLASIRQRDLRYLDTIS